MRKHCEICGRVDDNHMEDLKHKWVKGSQITSIVQLMEECFSFDGKPVFMGSDLIFPPVIKGKPVSVLMDCVATGVFHCAELNLEE